MAPRSKTAILSVMRVHRPCSKAPQVSQSCDHLSELGLKGGMKSLHSFVTASAAQRIDAPTRRIDATMRHFDRVVRLNDRPTRRCDPAARRLNGRARHCRGPLRHRDGSARRFDATLRHFDATTRHFDGQFVPVHRNQRPRLAPKQARERFVIYNDGSLVFRLRPQAQTK